MNSNRKERRRGVKRGPYRGVGREVLDTEDSWTPESERSTRPRRMVNYREKSDEILESEDVSESESENENENEQMDESPEMHMALFKMVLGTMHGDLVISAEQPKLNELAAVCSGMYEMESNLKMTDGSMLTPTFYEQNRTENNRTPAPHFIQRDVPSPPGTPLILKAYQTDQYYADPVAMAQLQHIQRPFIHY